MKVRLNKIPINSQGYADKGWTYYGIGKPLYRAQSEEEIIEETGSFWYEVDMEFRAYDREEAKEIVKEKYPEARFYS